MIYLLQKFMLGLLEIAILWIVYAIYCTEVRTQSEN